MIDQKTLKEKINYCSETGEFKRNGKILGNSRKDRVCGHINDQGYRLISIDGETYRAHRLAWIYMTGEEPKEIDHVNGIRSDNRFENLRNVSHQENQKNMRMHKDNKSGISGVSWNKDKEKWRVRISVNGKETFLGYANHLFEAACLRKSAELEYNFHPNHGTR